MAETNPTAQAVRVALANAAAQGAWLRYDGPCLEKLRLLLAKMLGRAHIRLCCSGTFGVELAIRSLHLSSDAEVLLAGYDFAGNLRSIQDAGATACLCDIVSDSWVPTMEQFQQSVGPKTKALVVSHLHGALAPMASICNWAHQLGICVIEDACQAHGAMVDGQPAGSWGDLSVFSFGGSKLIAAGRGGAVVTNDAQYSQRMKIFCERGNDSFPLSELQAAVILPQYERLKDDHLLRSQAARSLIVHLSRFEWLTTATAKTSDDPAFYKIGLMLHDSLFALTRVQQLVNFVGEADAKATMTSVRDWLLHRLEALEIQAGFGFRGFMRRSSSRCRQPFSLDNSQRASDATIVLHHSHLLDPETGESTIGRVMAAFDTLHQEMST